MVEGEIHMKRISLLLLLVVLVGCGKTVSNTSTNIDKDLVVEPEGMVLIRT